MKKVNVNNEAAVTKWLDIVQKKSLVRNFVASNLKRYVGLAEEKLRNAGLSSKDIVGAMIEVGYEEFPKCYKYIPFGTIITMKRQSKDWFVTAIARVDCRGKDFIILTEKQKEIIAKKAVMNCKNL